LFLFCCVVVAAVFVLLLLLLWLWLCAWLFWVVLLCCCAFLCKRALYNDAESFQSLNLATPPFHHHDHNSYVDRGPARKEYVEAFWTVANWDQVRMNYAAAVGGKVNNIVS
jgi:hypothetical protein